MLSSRYRRIVGRASVLTWVLRATVFDRTGLGPDPIREQFVLNEEYLPACRPPSWLGKRGLRLDA
jgi:hypothetical protein